MTPRVAFEALACVLLFACGGDAFVSGSDAGPRTTSGTSTGRAGSSGSSGSGGFGGIGGGGSAGRAGASGSGGASSGGSGGFGGIGGSGGSGGTTGCTLKPRIGCCFTDSVCSYRCYGATCDVGGEGKCEPKPPTGQCWDQRDCPTGSTCSGAVICPCGVGACFRADTPGMCVAVQ